MGARDDCAPGCGGMNAPPDVKRPSLATTAGETGNETRPESTPAAWREQTTFGLTLLVDSWRICYPGKPLPKNVQRALAAAWRRAA